MSTIANNPKVLLFDLDGTLLRNDKTVSDKTIAAINHCRKKGILIGFSTLRGTTTISAYIDAIKPEILVINGGALAYYNGHRIHHSSFSLNETRSILAAAYKTIGDSCEITLDTPDNLYWNRRLDKSQPYSNEALYSDMLDFREEALKICVQTWDEQTAAEIAKSVSDCQYDKFSDIPWYKFSKKTASKETAIRRLSEALHTEISEIFAFGDDYSDIGMLKCCGRGIAMGNAIDEVKAIADEITLSNEEDGIAHWIECNIL